MASGTSAGTNTTSRATTKATGGVGGGFPLNLQGRPLSERLGVTYWGSAYSSNRQQSGMVNACDELQKLGTKVLKLCANNLKQSYRFDTWGTYSSLKDILASDNFRGCFERSFTTYVIVAYEQSNIVWKDGVSESEYDKVESQFYSAAKYLLQTYSGQGKTFVFTNWEGDNMLAGDVSGNRVPGLIDYFNARQDGVNRAREETGMSDGCYVFNGVEINKVLTKTANNVGRLLDIVVPHTKADLYSYSDYESKDSGVVSSVETVRRRTMLALDTIAEKAPDSRWFGNKNVFIGEYGYPENSKNEAWVKMVVEGHVRAAVDWNAPYLVYWELFCNELKTNLSIPAQQPGNSDMKGLWLIRPDLTKTASYDYLAGLMDRVSY